MFVILVLCNTNLFSQNGVLSPEFNNECDNIIYTPKSIPSSLLVFLSGVKHPVFIYKGKDEYNRTIISAMKQYVKNLGFTAIIDNVEDIDLTGNICDYTYIGLSWDPSTIERNSIDIILEFESRCLNQTYTLMITKSKSADGGIYDNTYNYFYNAFFQMNKNQRGSYNINNRIKLNEKKTCWTEQKIKTDIDSKGCDKIEGVYEEVSSSNDEAKYKVAVKKILNTYYLIYLSGANNFGNWKEGEIKATLEPTSTTLFYKANWIMADKSENKNSYITFENGLFNLLLEGDKSVYVKMYPINNDSQIGNQEKSSGTGFALTSNGYIVTNYHVTNGATTIKVRGVNGDFSKSYIARVIVEDKINDLSIIKIDDQSFKTLGIVPYLIPNKSLEVGNSVFVLGYPLRSTMGDEIKLTNGIISSRSGYQGDITSYQISAPIQPGNSGGPLLDDQGNVVGVINAKHTGAENVSYAIKITYLINLIDMVSPKIKLQSVSLLNTKPLTEQVKILKNFTYIIEIN